MKIHSAKAMVQSQDDGNLYELDLIEHENELWLVPHWYDVPALGVTKPARIIRLKSFQYQVPAGNQKRYVVNTPVPTALLNASTPKQVIFGIEVRELPDISLPLIDKTKN